MSPVPVRNPYVGPRPIQAGEALYGRAAEVRELFDRLQARRIVLMHSPSGAGKSSLVAAGLIPKLQEAQFDVWRTIRVNLDPSGLAGVPAEANRYLLSAMLSLEEELPEGRRRTAAELADLDFLTYLERRPRRKGQRDRSVVLIFDQFEEVLTVAPRAIAEKRAFFGSIGRALDVGDHWALFIVREDHLGAFAPYRDLVPTQLANTFRLDLLGLEGAKEAAEQPAILAGRSFPAAEGLVRDLAMVRVQQADGRFAEEQGSYVEPVLLQVACHGVWEAVPADRRSIDPGDLPRSGVVSTSLGGYYAQAVKQVAGGDAAVERTIRRWVGERLIVDGARSQVRQDPDQSGGLDNALIGGLLESYLVRGESRGGVTWFELSHDRLIAPVQQDNAAWEEAHLHPMQVQARLWENGRRADTLLYSREALPAAIAWAAVHAELLSEGERAFLTQSRRYRAAEARRRWSVAGATTLLILLLFAGAAWTRWVGARDAEAERVSAEALRTLAGLRTAEALAAEARFAAAAAIEETARLREAQAEVERARAEKSLEDYYSRNPGMRPEAISLRQAARLDRWEALKASEDNARAEAWVHSIRREVVTIEQESDTLGEALAAHQADLASLEARHGGWRRPGVAAFTTLREGVWDGFAAARRTNGELRAQLLGLGLLAAPLREPGPLPSECHPATDPPSEQPQRTGYAYPPDEALMASLPGGEEYEPAGPEVLDAFWEQAVEVKGLQRRITFVEEDARSAGLEGAALRDDAARQAAKREAEAGRRAVASREATRALEAARAAHAQRTALRTATDTLGPRLFDLRWSAALVELDRAAYEKERCRLDAASSELRGEDEQLRARLEKGKDPSDAGATP